MKRFNSVFILLSVVSLLTAPCFAMGNYTYTTVQNEIYNASSPVGTFSNYNASAADYSKNQEYYPQTPNYYYPDLETPVHTVYDASVVTNEPNVAYTTSTIETPQSYSKQVTNTTTYRDEREKADKVIERSAKVAGILSGLALVGAFVTAIFCAI